MQKTIEKIRDTIAGYERLIQVIAEHSGVDSICRLSKKDISHIYGLSYTGTCKKLNFLLKNGIINQTSEGFKNEGKDIIKDTPLFLLPKLLTLVIEYPEYSNSFVSQAQSLAVSEEDIRTAWGFYSYFFSSKTPSKVEIEAISMGFGVNTGIIAKGV